MGAIMISVIVPAYNIENYIVRCLESLIGQTYKELEIIVVDDGSTDQTGRIIDDYAAKDYRILPIHKKNEGVSIARITGLEKTTGEYIGFADGDDIAEPQLYEHLLSNALKYRADISHCGYQMEFPDGRKDLYYGTGKLEVLDRERGLEALLRGDYIEPGLWNKLYRRELIKGIANSSIWDAEIRINEDLLMNYILFKQARTSIYEDCCLYRYMKRKGSASTSTVQRYKLTDPLKVISIIEKDTIDSEQLHGIAYDRYLRLLINTSQQKLSPEDAAIASELLKGEIKDRKRFLSGNSSKLRWMSFGAAKMPCCYGIVRKIYDKVTGKGKKYQV